MSLRARYNPINYTNIAGKIDHGLLLGLTDNDHVQYVNAVSDTASIDLTLTGQSIKGDIKPAGINHSAISQLLWSQAGHTIDSAINIPDDIKINFGDVADAYIQWNNASSCLEIGNASLIYTPSTNTLSTVNLNLSSNLQINGVLVFDDLSTSIFTDTIGELSIGGSVSVNIDAPITTLSGSLMLIDNKYISFGTSGYGTDASIEWNSGGYLDIQSADTRFSGAVTTTGLGTFGNLDVDTLNLDGNTISDSTGSISFSDENLLTTGNLTVGSTALDVDATNKTAAIGGSASSAVDLKIGGTKNISVTSSVLATTPQWTITAGAIKTAMLQFNGSITPNGYTLAEGNGVDAYSIYSMGNAASVITNVYNIKSTALFTTLKAAGSVGQCDMFYAGAIPTTSVTFTTIASCRLAEQVEGNTNWTLLCEGGNSHLGEYVRIGNDTITPTERLEIDFATEDLAFQDAKSTQATGTPAGWIKVDVGGNTRYIQLYSDVPT